MKRQQIRKMLLIISLLLFPVTLYYFSPALIIDAGLQGIVNGSFLVFCLLFLLAIPFGRLFCAYLCPAGGLQECAFAVKEKKPKQGRRLWIKYGIWAVWMGAVIFCYFHSGGIVAADFWFETEHGISVSSIQSYLIYYGILCLVLIPALLCGKRAFCHYFCWMAPFMTLGTKLRRFLRLPGLHIRAEKPDQCIACGNCEKVCPMGIDVMEEIKSGTVRSAECIQCGACADSCPRGVLCRGWRREA
ncbi:MAG: 4Fe-4S binding protein [Blautia sp.]|nr:4Fe-4S binding protein [Blautia sp.]MCM1202458.1 4Fe-4S binding protein [Bacteroides fragilis]